MFSQSEQLQISSFFETQHAVAKRDTTRAGFKWAGFLYKLMHANDNKIVMFLS